VEKAIELGAKMAKFSSPVLNMAKECVNESQNLGLDSGMLFERRVFHSTWGLGDRKEGMTAFQEKRKAEFQHK
jgi:enoyl-CoA hydratase